jgi:hypothetical protein
MIRKIWSACFADDYSILAKFHIVYRVTTHPFGVSALYYYIKGSMGASDGIRSIKSPFTIPNPIKLRFESAPCGMAKVSIINGALKSMSSLFWFKTFRKYLSVEIDIIEETVALFEVNPTKFHLNA